MDRQRYPEVLFPNEFVSRNPWDDSADPITYFPDNPLPATIPITKLVHITHAIEGRCIEKERGRRYEFSPKKKCGKSYEDNQGGGYGETYKYTGFDTGFEMYEKIQCTDSVFPGYLSWWGIDVRDGYVGSKLQQDVLQNEPSGRYVAEYLKIPPNSPYGNVAFSIKLSDILKYYKNARNSDHDQVCLKVGGTLRYRYEICYVVIVCLIDDDDDALRDMPSVVGRFPQFVSNGLVDDNGFVIDRKKTPEFKADNIIKSIKAGEDRTGRNRFNYDYHSWEQLVFAFYFPTNGQNLVCNTKVKKTDEYPHFVGNCQTCKTRLID